METKAQGPRLGGSERIRILAKDEERIDKLAKETGLPKVYLKREAISIGIAIWAKRFGVKLKKGNLKKAA